MNIKNRLQNYSRLNIEIEQLAERVLSLRHRMYSLRSSSDLSEIPASGGNSDKIGTAVATITDLENLYIEKLEKLIQEQKEIEKMIDGLDQVERVLIRARYIDCETWESVCGIIGYSWRQTHRLHAKILSKLGNNVQEVVSE